MRGLPLRFCAPQSRDPVLVESPHIVVGDDDVWPGGVAGDALEQSNAVCNGPALHLERERRRRDAAREEQSTEGAELVGGVSEARRRRISSRKPSCSSGDGAGQSRDAFLAVPARAGAPRSS